MRDYHRYLASREWRLKRREVLERSKGLCERCWGAKATQVHHLTYERLGHELPEDLMATCRADQEFLSATSDHDPVAALPTLAAPTGDDVMGQELTNLVLFEKWVHEGRPQDAQSGLMCNVTDLVVEHVRDWAYVSWLHFPSLPERRVAIAHAGGLYLTIQRAAGEENASMVLPLLETVGLAPEEHNPWKRWRLPVAWSREAA